MRGWGVLWCFGAQIRVVLWYFGELLFHVGVVVVLLGRFPKCPRVRMFVCALPL